MSYTPPWYLANGLVMTFHFALRGYLIWERHTVEPEPIYHSHIFIGANGVPIYGKYAIPKHPKGTIIATYGVAGHLEDQWFLKILGRKAYANGYAIVLFDWRAHGKTAMLSPAMSSDGIHEGEDYLLIANQAKQLGCPAKFWLMGYSVGGQLALWGIKKAEAIADWGDDLEIKAEDIAGAAVICPNMDSHRSLRYLMKNKLGKFLESRIARELQMMAKDMMRLHPESIDPEAVERVNSLWTFDHELIIKNLGFNSVEDYYQASSPLHFLHHLRKPTLIIYAANDPMFDPTIPTDLDRIAKVNQAIKLMLTKHGGHVSYMSSKRCQVHYGDRDRWWAWNRVFEWIEQA